MEWMVFFVWINGKPCIQKSTEQHISISTMFIVTSRNHTALIQIGPNIPVIYAAYILINLLNHNKRMIYWIIWRKIDKVRSSKTFILFLVFTDKYSYTKGLYFLSLIVSRHTVSHLLNLCNTLSYEMFSQNLRKRIK